MQADLATTALKGLRLIGWIGRPSGDGHQIDGGGDQPILTAELLLIELASLLKHTAAGGMARADNGAVAFAQGLQILKQASHVGVQNF